MVNRTHRTLVACCGTFDGNIHPGHINFLRQSKECGDRLYVFVVPDWIVQRNKSREATFTQKDRVKHVAALQIATKVIPLIGTDENHLEQIAAVEPDVYCLGEDQNDPFALKLQRTLRNSGVRFIRIKRYRPHRFSTTLLSSGKHRS